MSAQVDLDEIKAIASERGGAVAFRTADDAFEVCVLWIKRFEDGMVRIHVQGDEHHVFLVPSDSFDSLLTSGKL